MTDSKNSYQASSAGTPNNYLVMTLMGLLVIASFVIGMLWTKTKTPSAPQGQQAAAVDDKTIRSVLELNDSDHVRGKADSDLVLIEYSDFSCPYCQSYHPNVKAAIEQAGDVAYVYRHFPLPSIHPNAQKQAEASECAAKIGGNEAFWKYADAIFSTKSGTQEQLITLALEQGLDEGSFTSCLTSGETAKKVSSDQENGLKIGIRGTPSSFVINTKTGDFEQIGGAASTETVLQAIEKVR
ncbi:DsbA family protein [Candidatus Nomurabacteria bacterium]|uniref:DsbA family protein n=1 Tax=candidate division WWE3 bacterium TaxID=2053526 RepID=A0A955IVX7_UNCKA|nr:DsbA family protein [candidate division WWE3 bacterium]MCB9823558.1 DsbA family protein [Candidatus Nomurabacteria bacterium]MCB9827353.1 DsbA family protein [Candidatus Nomurabacteria bacterium]HXK52907.1 DsbA family protein [bacterium]